MRNLIIVLLMLLIGSPQAAPLMRFDRLGLADGLSQSATYDIIQDKQGFIWIGTQDGLNRYDGYQFKVFRHQLDDTSSIIDNDVTALLQGEDDTLWVGTNKGVCRYYITTQSFDCFGYNKQSDQPLKSRVHSFAKDADNNIWIGTFGQGVAVYQHDSDSFVYYRHDTDNPRSLSEDRVNKVLHDSHGTIWIGTRDGGLNRFDGAEKGFTRFTHRFSDPTSLSHNGVTDMFQDSDGVLWVSTDGGGLNRFDHNTNRFSHYKAGGPNSIGSNRVWQTYEDSRGIFWVGHEKGLDRFDKTNERFYHYQHQSSDLMSLSHNAVHVIMEDKNAMMWFGTYGGGINKYNVAKEQFNHYRHISWQDNSLSHNTVMGMHVDSKQRLWIGTDGGGANILDLKTNNFSYLRHEAGNSQSIAGDQVRAVYDDNDGVIWLGLWNVGVTAYNPKDQSFRHYYSKKEVKNGLNSNRVTGFWQDKQGNMWIITFGGGLNFLDVQTGQFSHYVHDSNDATSIGNNYITDLWVDEQGLFWLATDSGLVKFNPKNRRASTLRHEQGNDKSLGNDIVTTILKDRRGIIWVGTYGGGLNRFNPDTGHFSQFRQSDGLANDSVYGILEDNEGLLWISTNKGLSRFDSETQTFTNFTVEDGLQSNEFNGLAFAQSDDGELIFGGVNGFNRFYGEQIKRADSPPTVVFTDVLRFNQPVPITPDAQKINGLHLTESIEVADNLTLDHTDALVTFRFAALDYANPNANLYRYKLEGFDQQWITTDATNRRATYTNLPSGEYVLKVQAGNPHRVWNEQGAQLQLKVLAPPWQSGWAYLLYAFLFVSLILLLVYVGIERRKVQMERTANRRLKQVDKIKDAFLSNTAFEFNTPLSSIISLTESLIGGSAGQLPDKANNTLAVVVSSSRRLSNLINDIVDFSKLSNDSMSLNTQPLDLHTLADVVLTTTKPLLGEKSVALLNEVPRELPQVLADEVRLKQVLYNLVEHAIKFTPKGHVRIKAKLVGDKVEVLVNDSGIGLDQDEFQTMFDRREEQRTEGSKGLSLAVVKQLVTLHGSSIKVKSKIDVGSTVSFVLQGINELAEYQAQANEPVQSEFENKTISNQDTDVDLSELQPFFVDNEPGLFKILLVDDERVNLEVFHNYLSPVGYQLVKAQSGEQALGILHNQGHFDLVLMDIMMPRMSGFELCKRIREYWPIHDLPIIMLSNGDAAHDLIQCYVAGANDCLSKPISRHELLIRVAGHLNMLDITRNLERRVTQRTELLELQKSEVEKKVAQRTNDLEQSNRSLAALSQICSEISAVLDWDKLLLAVYEHIKELMETEIFWIGLYQPKKQRISFELAIENDELLPNTYIAMHEKNLPAVWCIENKQPLIINDLDEEYSFYFGDVPIPEPKVGAKPLSLIYWPLTARGKILGVISIQSFHKNAYTYSELEVIRTVASTTAIALDNARAYREIERQKSEVEAKVAQRTEQLELKNKEILETQQQLVQSEKMASLGTLTAGVAHEINNPTNFVHVSTQNLEVDLSRFEQFILALAGDDADEEILQTFEQQFKPLHDHIKTIKDGTTRIKGIVKDLRAFTHLDADDKQLVQIQETLDSTINLTKTQFLEIAEVSTDYQDDPEILCYPAQLSQVFMNLIVNACDAIRERRETETNDYQGTIKIGLQVVERGIELTFKDNGNGMSEVTMNKLFEPFYTTKRVGEGTGLGLSISYSIIEKHQGELKVCSTIGQGTQFTLFLPTQ